MLVSIHITGTPGKDFFFFLLPPPPPKTENKCSYADDI